MIIHRLAVTKWVLAAVFGSLHAGGDATGGSAADTDVAAPAHPRLDALEARAMAGATKRVQWRGLRSACEVGAAKCVRWRGMRRRARGRGLRRVRRPELAPRARQRGLQRRVRRRGLRPPVQRSARCSDERPHATTNQNKRGARRQPGPPDEGPATLGKERPPRAAARNAAVDDAAARRERVATILQEIAAIAAGAENHGLKTVDEAAAEDEAAGATPAL